MVTMSCNTIKGCNKRHSEFFKCNSGFGKYNERMGEDGSLKAEVRNRKKEAA